MTHTQHPLVYFKLIPPSFAIQLNSTSVYCISEQRGTLGLSYAAGAAHLFDPRGTRVSLWSAYLLTSSQFAFLSFPSIDWMFQRHGNLNDTGELSNDCGVRWGWEKGEVKSTPPGRHGASLSSSVGEDPLSLIALNCFCKHDTAAATRLLITLC